MGAVFLPGDAMTISTALVCTDCQELSELGTRQCKCSSKNLYPISTWLEAVISSCRLIEGPKSPLFDPIFEAVERAEAMDYDG